MSNKIKKDFSLFVAAGGGIVLVVALIVAATVAFEAFVLYFLLNFALYVFGLTLSITYFQAIGVTILLNILRSIFSGKSPIEIEINK